jgi:ADP-dependent NAD(P)H-hydrate dehydratase / NAD(P)H-hydrate epimerase
MMNDPVDKSLRGVFSVADVRAIDAAAIAGGIKGIKLMARAAQFALDVAMSRFPEARRWQVLCGSGNNAGDGYLLARLAQARGIVVEVLAVAAPDTLTGDAQKAWQVAAEQGVTITPFAGALSADAELLVDSLLGSGLARDVSGAYADAVKAMNAHPAPCLAIDIPTGIHGDSGEVMGVAVQAAATCTFVGRKTGLYLAAGPEHCGVIDFSTLEIPADCYAAATAQLVVIDDARLTAALPRRSRQAHKGVFGHVVIVGGGPGMPGAARLAGEAALRSGAGRVTVACHPANTAAITATRPELMCYGVKTATELAPLLAAATVVALGPGLGTDHWAQSMYDAATTFAGPLVLDADALNLLAATPEKSVQRILTPHPGEAARLLGSTSAAVQADRPAAVAELQARFGGVVVLKGYGTLVANGSGPPALCTAGNPGMAAPGMGDVLTGVVAALVAQGLALDDAALCGVFAHARAGDLAAAAGERGMLASDVIEGLRACLNP